MDLDRDDMKLYSLLVQKEELAYVSQENHKKELTIKMTDKKIIEQKLPHWDLKDLYPGFDSEKFKNDLKKFGQLAEEFAAKYQTKIKNCKDSDFLLQSIRDYESMSDISAKVGSYSFLEYVTQTNKPEIVSSFQNTRETLSKMAEKLIFYSLELNQIDDESMATMLQDDSIKHYNTWIKNLREAKPYQLDEKIELVLHQKSITSNASWQRLFDETMADMRFDWQGKKVTLAKITNELSSNDEKLRRKAGKVLGDELGKRAKEMALVTNVLAKDKQIDDEMRGFKRPIDSMNLANLLEGEVVDNLIKTVRKNFNKTSHRYYKMKAKWLGKDSLYYTDRNAPLTCFNVKEQHFTWDEARKIILEAYNDFSPEMAKIAQQFFDNNWIDAPVGEGKDAGAFAHPVATSIHPYLLVNFQGKLRDVMTLAHELGHGIHQMLSRRQGPLMSDTPLTLAETASVFGEQLVFRKLLAMQKDKQYRKYMIASKVEDMINTVIRQIAFCEFEIRLHDLRKNGEVSLEQINELWLSVQKESLGDAVEYGEEYKYYWSYIPHFIHSPFYVYSYAFGDCLVNSLYNEYRINPEGFAEKYLELLSAGGSKRHKELLSPFGLDASNPDFWQKGVDYLIGLIDELEGL